MKVNDADYFREAMGKEISSFNDEKMFELVPLKEKLPHESLAPFVWSFRRK